MKHMDSYFIKAKDQNLYFCGWNKLGEIVVNDDPALIYRMKRTVAMRNLYKIEDYLNKPCTVEMMAI